ncbi:hypothetical protein OHA10_37060 [Kribbella sp. NBC_00662]|uniref:hypothetical protein n=1 Tax=Kribbella sp. NBC_00662 TaxID=2975969 RepID=UPI003251F4EB
MPEATASRNSGQGWTDEQVRQLRELAEGNTPVGVMSVKLGQTEEAVRSQAAGAHHAGAAERAP